MVASVVLVEGVGPVVAVIVSVLLVVAIGLCGGLPVTRHEQADEIRDGILWH